MDIGSNEFSHMFTICFDHIFIFWNILFFYRYTGVSYISVDCEYIDQNSLGADEFKDIPLDVRDLHEILLDKAQKELEEDPQI